MKILPYIVALLLVAGALFGAYHHGETVANDDWQARWSERDARDEAAKAANEAAEREKEQARQQAINKVVQDGQHIIDQVTADAAAERASRSGLQFTVDDLARRLTASQGSSHSCTAAASAAASRAVLVLADVLKRSDERSGDLAGYADQSHSRGVTCTQAYDALGE